MLDDPEDSVSDAEGIAGEKNNKMRFGGD